MANYCPNCGRSVDAGASFCSNCGAALNGNTNAQGSAYTSPSPAASAAGGILGTLVAVSLIGGLTRRLYYYGGRYYLDPYCRRPFMDMHRIIGGPRFIGGPHGGPRGPMGLGGPGRPMGPGGHGGPRGGRR